MATLVKSPKAHAVAREIKDILQPVDGDLQRVTARLLKHVQSSVAHKAVYLITAGGKQLRPALVMLAGRSGDYQKRYEALLDLAVATELIHTATLIHDDIIDESLLRRQQPTFHQRFGTERAVLMGDYLYATAFAIVAGLGDAQVTSVMARVGQQLSRGEFLEVESRCNVEMTEAAYLEIIGEKTASLIAACCHLGAHLAGAASHTVDRLREFGWHFGIAFQIMDDCLDLIGEEQTVGKTLRADLDKGSLSLPVIYVAQALPKRKREALFAPLRNRTLEKTGLLRIAEEARRSGAIAQALGKASGFIQTALERIDTQQGVILAETFQELARYAIGRVK